MWLSHRIVSVVSDIVQYFSIECDKRAKSDFNSLVDTIDKWNELIIQSVHWITWVSIDKRHYPCDGDLFCFILSSCEITKFWHFQWDWWMMKMVIFPKGTVFCRCCCLFFFFLSLWFNFWSAKINSKSQETKIIHTNWQHMKSLRFRLIRSFGIRSFCMLYKSTHLYL